MRWIDKWVGIPLCFFLSILNSITRRFNKGDKIKNILFIQLSEMGSAVEVIPCIQDIKKAHPNAQIYYLIFKEMSGIIRIIGIIQDENILTIRNSSLITFTIDTVKIIWRLRKLKMDVVIDLELFSRFSSLLAYLSKTRIKIGFHKFKMEGLYKGNFYTHPVIYNPYKHISVNYLNLTRSLDSLGGIPYLKERPDQKFDEFYIKSTEKEKKLILDKLRESFPNINEKSKIVILNSNAGSLIPVRRWPIENYCELARKITRDKNAFVVLTGDKFEREEGEIICKYLDHKNCINLAGKTTLKELFDLFNISNMIVSNDSGPAHFATLTKIHIIVLFGPETPTLYSPLSKNLTVIYSNFACSPCVSAYNHRRSSCKDNKCLKVIKVDDVFKEVEKVLNK